jgi:hypothetical protein
MTPPLSDGANSGFLRAGALHAIIFVTDENDCSGLEATGRTGEDCYTRADELTPVTELLQAGEGRLLIKRLCWAGGAVA